MNKTRKAAIIFILILSLSFNTPTYASMCIEEIFEKRDIDIATKSYLGWIRVLNNGIKREEYNLDDLSEEEIEFLIDELKEMHSKEFN